MVVALVMLMLRHSLAKTKSFSKWVGFDHLPLSQRLRNMLDFMAKVLVDFIYRNIFIVFINLTRFLPRSNSKMNSSKQPDYLTKGVR